jgi:hypothetical protein
MSAAQGAVPCLQQRQQVEIRGVGGGQLSERDHAPITCLSTIHNRHEKNQTTMVDPCTVVEEESNRYQPYTRGPWPQACGAGRTKEREVGEGQASIGNGIRTSFSLSDEVTAFSSRAVGEIGACCVWQWQAPFFALQ